MVVAGNPKPCPALAGVMNMTDSQSGVSRHKEVVQIAPTTYKAEPSIRAGVIRRVHVMKNPVETPAMVRQQEGAISRNPDFEGLSSFTAWKYNGALNMTVLQTMFPAKGQRTPTVLET